MKILVPYKDIARRKITDKVVSGGIERFIRNLLEHIDGVETIDVTDIYHDPDKVARMVGEAAEEFDLVICNYPNEGLNVKLREKTTTPIAWICHHTACLDPRWKIVGDNMVNLSREPGCSIWMVSQSQLDGWSAWFPELQLATRDFIRPGYAKPNWIFPSKYDAATVGRCQKMKDPFLLHRIGREQRLETYVMTNSVGSSDLVYENENRDWKHPQVTVWNGSDDEVKNNLRHAGCFLVTWTGETFGIAALEALSLGVPIVMISNDGTHACTELVKNIDHGVVVSPDWKDITFAIKTYRSWDLSKREKIARAVYEKFNVYEWAKKIGTMTERAVQ